MSYSSPQNGFTVPLGMVGPTKFGRYSEISPEQTFNMIISDGYLVNYAGYKLRTMIPGENGRGLFSSSRASIMALVVDDKFYIVTGGLVAIEKGSLSTFSGDVFIDENDVHQLAICDKKNIYIYDYVTDEFSVALKSSGPDVPLDFVPGYVAFQDGYFIAPDIANSLGGASWRLSAINNGKLWPSNKNTIGLFQTKPDTPQACIRFPSGGNLLYVFGKTVVEPWYNAGTYPFPYQRSSSFNCDYGCLNADTIAEGDTFIIWLGANEKSGPVIMYSTGGDVTQISNDGINFKLSQLHNPSVAYAFLFKQDGHLIYQITFPDPLDNVSYAYDFNTQQFFNVTDENLNFHIAKQVVFFNNSYYFISLRDGNLYEFGTQFTDFDYGNDITFPMPRLRFCPTVKAPGTVPFIATNVNFPIEQGNLNDVARVDLAVSRDGGYTYSSDVPRYTNNLGYRSNRMTFTRLGYGNRFTPRFKFQGHGRVVVGEGVMEGRS